MIVFLGKIRRVVPAIRLLACFLVILPYRVARQRVVVQLAGLARVRGVGAVIRLLGVRVGIKTALPAVLSFPAHRAFTISAQQTRKRTDVVQQI